MKQLAILLLATFVCASCNNNTQDDTRVIDYLQKAYTTKEVTVKHSARMAEGAAQKVFEVEMRSPSFNVNSMKLDSLDEAIVQQVLPLLSPETRAAHDELLVRIIQWQVGKDRDMERSVPLK